MYKCKTYHVSNLGVFNKDLSRNIIIKVGIFSNRLATIIACFLYTKLYMCNFASYTIQNVLLYIHKINEQLKQLHAWGCGTAEVDH